MCRHIYRPVKAAASVRKVREEALEDRYQWEAASESVLARVVHHGDEERARLESALACGAERLMLLSLYILHRDKTAGH